MEYTFKYNEFFNQDIIDKFKNGYHIKQLTFELDREVKKNDVDNIDISIQGHDDMTGVSIGILKDDIVYYSNNIILKCDSLQNCFLLNYLQNNEYNDISIFCTFNENYLLDDDFSFRDYKTCTILLHTNFYFFKYVYITDKNHKDTLYSNVFDTFNEFKKYIIENNNVNKNKFNEWFDNFLRYDTYIYSMNNNEHKKLFVKE